MCAVQVVWNSRESRKNRVIGLAECYIEFLVWLALKSLGFLGGIEDVLSYKYVLETFLGVRWHRERS